MAEEIMLDVKGLRKSFGALKATDDLNLSVEKGHIHALIGPNGAGKTTLISQLSGELTPDEGVVLFDGHDITDMPVHQRPHLGLARSFQITSVLPNFTALDNVAMAVQAHTGHSFKFWKKARKQKELRDPAFEALETVGLAARANELVRNLAHGEQRQLELAMAMAMKPVMLLLDEPMAGMGVEESQSMVDVLQRLAGRVTMLVCEPDMVAVFALADRISGLVYGHTIATGTPDAIRNNEQVRQAYLGEEA